MDRVLKARPLPRVWLFLDEPEQTATRAAAALAAARELGRRRYTALVIDADDHRPDLRLFPCLYLIRNPGPVTLFDLVLAFEPNPFSPLACDF